MFYAVLSKGEKLMRKKKAVIRVIAIISVILMLFGVVVMFAGCSDSDTNTEYKALVPATFAKVCATTMDDCRSYVIVHVETGVLYLWNWGAYSSGITALLDADGKPLLYEDYVK